MIEITVAREVASPPPPHSRHFEAPRWWPEWMAQVLAPTLRSAGAPGARLLPVAMSAVASITAATANPGAAAKPASAPASGPEAAYGAAAAALRGALGEAQEGVASADDWAAANAQHQVWRARRVVRALLDSAAGPGPGSRLEWCLCGEDAAAG